MAKEYKVNLFEEKTADRFRPVSGRYDAFVDREGVRYSSNQKILPKDEMNVLLRKGYNPERVYKAIADIRERLSMDESVRLRIGVKNVKTDLGDIDLDSLAEIALRHEMRRAA